MLDKEKAIKIVEKLILNDESRLATMFLESHKKMIILYRGHQVELKEKSLTYIPPKTDERKSTTLTLKKKEAKALKTLFLEEKEKRDKAHTSEKFDELKGFINDEKE